MMDYDNTYTRDPLMWRNIIKIMEDNGHNIRIVTSRSPDMILDDDWVLNKLPITYCSFRAKKTVCEEQGISIDIWIDDDPLYITTGFIE